MARLVSYLLPVRGRPPGRGTVLPVGIGALAEHALTSSRLATLHRHANWAAVLVVLAALLHGGISLVKIAAICALIFAAGVATIELLLPNDATRRDGPILGNPAFLAVGVGPATVFVVSIMLRLVGLSDSAVDLILHRRLQGRRTMSSAEIGRLKNTGLSEKQILERINQGMTDAQADHEAAFREATRNHAGTGFTHVRGRRR